jgi:hypothetical protein
MTLIIKVEGITKLWIYNDELRDLYGRIRSYLNQCDTLLTDPLLKASTVLQHIFLSPESKYQRVYEALTTAQNKISSHLLKKVQSFKGKETELEDDITSTGPDRILRSFLSYTLTYLQRLLLSPRAKPIAEFRSSRSSPIIFATTATGDSDGDGNLNVLRGSY